MNGGTYSGCSCLVFVDGDTLIVLLALIAGFLGTAVCLSDLEDVWDGFCDDCFDLLLLYDLK